MYHAQTPLLPKTTDLSQLVTSISRRATLVNQHLISLAVADLTQVPRTELVGKWRKYG
jgi:hypothetical protein